MPLPWFTEAPESVGREVRDFVSSHPTLDHPEVVIVCDGSEQQDLLDTLEGLSRSGGDRIRVVHCPDNLGVGQQDGIYPPSLPRVRDFTGTLAMTASRTVTPGLTSSSSSSSSEVGTNLTDPSGCLTRE